MGMKETVLKFVGRINAHDVEGILDLLAEDYRFINSAGDTFRGNSFMRATWRAHFAQYPDFHIDVEHVLADDGAVGIFGVARGTYSKEGEILEETTGKCPPLSWDCPGRPHAPLAGLLRHFDDFRLDQGQRITARRASEPPARQGRFLFVKALRWVPMMRRFGLAMIGSLIGLAGCDTATTETGYDPHRLGMGDAQRRALYAPRYSPEQAQAQAERDQEAKRKPGSGGGLMQPY